MGALRALLPSQTGELTLGSPQRENTQKPTLAHSFVPIVFLNFLSIDKSTCFAERNRTSPACWCPQTTYWTAPAIRWMPGPERPFGTNRNVASSVLASLARPACPACAVCLLCKHCLLCPSCLPCLRDVLASLARPACSACAVCLLCRPCLLCPSCLPCLTLPAHLPCLPCLRRCSALLASKCACLVLGTSI